MVAHAELVKQLKALRVARGLSQMRLAELMGTSQARIWELEKALTDVKISTFERWAKALGATINISLALAEE